MEGKAYQYSIRDARDNVSYFQELKHFDNYREEQFKDDPKLLKAFQAAENEILRASENYISKRGWGFYKDCRDKTAFKDQCKIAMQEFVKAFKSIHPDCSKNNEQRKKFMYCIQKLQMYAANTQAAKKNNKPFQSAKTPKFFKDMFKQDNETVATAATKKTTITFK